MVSRDCWVMTENLGGQCLSIVVFLELKSMKKCVTMMNYNGKGLLKILCLVEAGCKA